MGDQRFSDGERDVLSSVLDELIPPSGDGRLPGAGQLGLVDYIEGALRALPDLKAMIAQGLQVLERLAHERYGRPFAALARAEKLQMLNEQAFVLPLTFHTFTGYYQHARVVTALGLAPRAPHPLGYEMPPNDLTLLDAVRQRAKLYRQD